MNKYKDKYDIKILCKILNVTRSDYYYNIKNPINSYEIANNKLDIEIKRIFYGSKKRYGSPKIARQLNNEGIKVSQKRVARRMKILGLRSITVNKFNHAGKSNTDNAKEYPNLLEQDFLQKNLVRNGLEILLIFILKKQAGLI